MADWGFIGLNSSILFCWVSVTQWLESCLTICWLHETGNLMWGYKLIGDSLSVDVVAELLRYLLFEKTSLGENLHMEKKKSTPSTVRGWSDHAFRVVSESRKNPLAIAGTDESVEFWRIDSSVASDVWLTFCIFAQRSLIPFGLPTWNFLRWPWFKRGPFARTWHSFCCEWILLWLWQRRQKTTNTPFLECLRIIFQQRKNRGASCATISWK